MPPRPLGFHLRLALIAAAALVLRVLYTVLLARHVKGAGDFFFYDGSANLLADGRGYIDPYLSTAGHPYPTALHPPLWPFSLALASKLGVRSLLGHRLVGCIFGTATVVLIGLIGRRVGGERLGLVAAGIAALYPTLVAADGSLMSESLYGMFVAGALLLTLAMLRRPSAWLGLVLGACIGLSALTRGEGLLFLPVLALPAAWLAARPRRLLRSVAALLGAVVLIAPWTARNWSVFDRPILISTNDSTVLAGANCGPTYHGRDLGYWRLDCISQRRPGLNEAQQAATWRRQGARYARHHLGRLVPVATVRVLRTWDFWQPRRQIGFAEGRQRRVTQAGTAAYYVLLALAVYGAVAVRRRRAELLTLLAPFVVVTLSTAAGFGLPRFRQAAEISLVVLAAVAVERLLERRRLRTTR